MDLMFQDRAPVDVQCRKILDSLLDSTYGLIEDSDEIFARFLNTHTNPGERASQYIQKLQVLLSTDVKRNRVSQSAASHQLLKQFKRGCWDDTLILQLELKHEKSFDFAELLLQLQTEENKRVTKLDRTH